MGANRPLIRVTKGFIIPVSKKNYKSRGKSLRALGLFTGRSDTESGKRQIRRIEQRLKRSDETLQLYIRPDKYLGAKISSKKAALLKERGYAVIKTKSGYRFFGERQYAKRIRYSEKADAIIREFPNRRSVTYPLDDSPGTLRRIENFFRTRKPNQFLTLRVGDNSPFNIVITSLADFNKYADKLMRDWHRKFKDAPQNYPGPYLQIVEVTAYDDADEETEEN